MATSWQQKFWRAPEFCEVKVGSFDRRYALRRHAERVALYLGLLHNACV